MDEDAAEQPQSLKKKIVGNQLCGLLIVMHSFFSPSCTLVINQEIYMLQQFYEA